MQAQQHHDETGIAMAKLFWVWLSVGISQLTPLQAVQFIASIFAIVYTAVQLWILVRDKIMRDK